MGKTVQERTSNVMFTTLQRGKGYLAEEVNTYIETIRNAYILLETEYNEKVKENAKLTAQLNRANDGDVGDTANYIQQISELTHKLKEQEMLVLQLKEREAGGLEAGESHQQQAEKIAAMTEKFQQHALRFEEEKKALQNEIQNKEEEIRRLQEAQEPKKKIEVQQRPVAVQMEETDTIRLAAQFLQSLDSGQGAASGYGIDGQQKADGQ